MSIDQRKGGLATDWLLRPTAIRCEFGCERRQAAGAIQRDDFLAIAVESNWRAVHQCVEFLRRSHHVWTDFRSQSTVYLEKCFSCCGECHSLRQRFVEVANRHVATRRHARLVRVRSEQTSNQRFDCCLELGIHAAEFRGDPSIDRSQQLAIALTALALRFRSDRLPPLPN